MTQPDQEPQEEQTVGELVERIAKLLATHSKILLEMAERDLNMLKRIESLENQVQALKDGVR